MTAPASGTPYRAATSQFGDPLSEHFDRAPVGMILLGEDRKVLSANEAMVLITGIPGSVMQGSTLGRFLSSDAPVDLEDRIFEELARSGHWLGELELRTAVGDASPMMVSLTPVGSASGAVRYIGSVVELGQQRWIESESSRRAAELAAFAALAVATGSSADPKEMLSAAARQIVERLEVDACWIHRFDATESRLNLAGEASYLNPSLQFSSRMIPDAINPAILRAIETREQVVESELLDRSIATIVHAPLLAQDEVVGVISILSVEGEKLSSRSSDLLRAVSYQLGTAIQNIRLLESVRLQQNELQETNAQLEQTVEALKTADRLKNEFLANTSHELRTPLNSIIGFLNLVLDGLCQSEEEQRELLGHAVRSGRQLLELINDVLDLARIEAGRLQVELQAVQLAPILAEAANTLAVQAHEKQLEFQVATVPASVVVSVDDARVHQILVNVIGNAIKFTKKGAVTVEVDASDGSPFVDICVKDTGIGVRAERQERLFKKFSQADASTTRKFGGSGLGLVIAKELVEMMGGSIRLESEGEGLGTTVWITLARWGGGKGTAPAAPPTVS